MRTRIYFEHKTDTILPWNYQYAVQQWIYQTISKADNVLAAMLHDCGYTYEGKTFKLFCFGPWVSYPFKIISNTGIKFLTSTSYIEISFLLPTVLSTFVSGLFREQKHTFHFRGKVKIDVVTSKIDILHEPNFKEGSATYKITTGARISVGEQGQEHPQYKGPEHQDYDFLFIQNLVNKHRSSLLYKGEPNSEYVIGMQVFEPVKTQMVTVPKDGIDIKMKGYKFTFELNAPAEIHRTLYYAGAGEECSLGMGWVEVLE